MNFFFLDFIIKICLSALMFLIALAIYITMKITDKSDKSINNNKKKGKDEN